MRNQGSSDRFFLDPKVDPTCVYTAALSKGNQNLTLSPPYQGGFRGIDIFDTDARTIKLV